MSKFSRFKSFDSNYSDTSDDLGDDISGDELRNQFEGVSNKIICEKLKFPYEPVELDLATLNDESVWDDLQIETTPSDNLLFELTRELLAVRIESLFSVLLKNKEFSHRGLYLSTLLIKLNPADYTAWYYRFKCLKLLDLNLEEELEFSRKITFESIKSYQSWNHRRHICTIANSPFNELEFVKLEIGTSPKNQSAWAYLTWLIKTFGTPNRSDEFEFVHFLVKNDIYNNSAWNYKNFLIKHFQDLDLEFIVGELLLDFHAFTERPDNESLCSYLIDMAMYTQTMFHGCINNMDTDHMNTVKAKCRNIYCLNNEYKCGGPVTNCLIKSIKSLRSSVQLLRFLKSLNRNEKVSRELAIMDPIRSQFYESKKDGLDAKST